MRRGRLGELSNVHHPPLLSVDTGDFLTASYLWTQEVRSLPGAVV